jgi:hypothetical protein
MIPLGIIISNIPAREWPGYDTGFQLSDIYSSNGTSYPRIVL